MRKAMICIIVATAFTLPGLPLLFFGPFWFKIVYGIGWLACLAFCALEKVWEPGDGYD